MRWEYAKSWKMLAVVLNQICAVVLVLSVAVCTFFAGSRGFSWVGSDESFESTAYYQSEVLEQIYRCIRAASRESKFEKDGVYDSDLLVDVEEYAQSSTILEGDPADGRLYYRLTDLLNWSLDGFETVTLMKLTYDDGSVGYLSKSSRNYTEQSVYEDGSAVASISSVGGSEEYSEENFEDGLPEEIAAQDSGAAQEAGDSGQVSEAAQTEEGAVPWEDIISAEPGTLEEADIFGMGQATVQNVEQIEAVEERYSPAGYDSLTSYAEEHDLSTARLQNLYYDLENILPVIYNDFYAYKENLELFSPSMTNMRYLVLPKSVTEVTPEDCEKKVYTNIRSFGGAQFTDPEGLLAYIRSFRDYLIYDSSNMDLESANMPISLSELSSYVKSYPPSVEGDYILAVAVDPSYMASDNLQQYKQQFEEIRPVSRLAVYGAVLGGLLYLLTMVYLTMAAGRAPDGDGAIRLNRFDRIRTEAALLLVAVPAVLLLAAGILLRPLSLGMTGFALGGGGVTLLFNCLFLTGYLSLVRRVRSGTLWTNSVLNLLVSAARKALRGRKAATKMMLSYGSFLLLNLLFLCLGFLGLFLAVIFDVGVGVFLLRQAVQRQRVLDGIEKISEGDLKAQIPVEHLGGDNLVLAEAVNQMGKGLSVAVEKSVKDEKLKSDLITNVSHDIKTPLTSIINYVDLLKREDIKNERAKNYIAILEDKALRLKHLTDDLVEASKISSDPLLTSRLFNLLQEVDFLPPPSEENQTRRTAFNLAPQQKPVNIDMEGPRDQHATQVWVAIAAMTGKPLQIGKALVNDAVSDCVHMFNLMGANLHRDGNVIRHGTDCTPAGTPDKVLHVGKNPFNFYLGLAHYIGRPGHTRFSGGTELRLANFTPLRHFLPELGSRIIPLVPKTEGLPLRVECSGLLPDTIGGIYGSPHYRSPLLRQADCHRFGRP